MSSTSKKELFSQIIQMAKERKEMEKVYLEEIKKREECLRQTETDTVELSNRLKNVRKDLNSWKEECFKWKSQCEVQEVEKAELKRQLKNHEYKIVLKDKQAADFDLEREKLFGEIRKYEEYTTALEIKIFKFNSDKEDLQDQLEKDKIQISAQSREIEELRTEVKDLKGLLKAREPEFASLLAQNEDLMREKMELQKQLIKQKATLKNSKKDFEGLKGELDDSKAENSELKRKIEGLKAGKALLEKSSENCTGELEKKIRDLEEENAALKKRIEGICAENALLKENNDLTGILQKQLEELKERNSDLQKEMANMNPVPVRDESVKNDDSPRQNDEFCQSTVMEESKDIPMEVDGLNDDLNADESKETIVNDQMVKELKISLEDERAKAQEIAENKQKEIDDLTGEMSKCMDENEYLRDKITDLEKRVVLHPALGTNYTPRKPQGKKRPKSSPPKFPELKITKTYSRSAPPAVKDKSKSRMLFSLTSNETLNIEDSDGAI